LELRVSCTEKVDKHLFATTLHDLCHVLWRHGAKLLRPAACGIEVAVLGLPIHVDLRG
jgi:hypothetical protein